MPREVSLSRRSNQMISPLGRRLVVAIKDALAHARHEIDLQCSIMVPLQVRSRDQYTTQRGGGGSMASSAPQ
jgi:hypothetical protein